MAKKDESAKAKRREALMRQLEQAQRERLEMEGAVETSPGVYESSPIGRAIRQTWRTARDTARQTRDTAADRAGRTLGTIGGLIQRSPGVRAAQYLIDQTAPIFRTERTDFNPEPVPEPATAQRTATPPPLNYVQNYATGDIGGAGLQYNPLERQGLQSPATTPLTAPPSNQFMRREATGTKVPWPDGPAQQGRDEVTDLYESLQAQGRTVGEMQSGAIQRPNGEGVSGTYRAFASWSPAQMEARKRAATADRSRLVELTARALGGSAPAGVGATPPATAPGLQATAPTVPATTAQNNTGRTPLEDSDMELRTIRDETEKGARGDKGQSVARQVLRQSQPLSPYQQAQRRIGNEVTEGSMPRGRVYTPVGLGAKTSVGRTPLGIGASRGVNDYWRTRGGQDNYG